MFLKCDFSVRFGALVVNNRIRTKRLYQRRVAVQSPQ